MTIRQLYYTSCRHGTEGIQGFQVNAATPGLDRAAVDTGLQLSLYRPPPSAPSLPTPDQLDAMPVAVGYRPCGNYAVLFHSRYLGADFTGRQGNYFAHVLVLDAPEQDLAGMLPVEAWGGASWRWTTVDQTELPVLGEVPLGDLQRWSPGAHLRDGRLPEFGRLLTAIQEALRSRGAKVVLVAQSDEAAARAVAAVSRSLPRALAVELSFVTFTTSPGDIDVVVAGTSPDVPIPVSPLGDQIVVRLGEGPGHERADVSRYARTLESCWLRSDDEAEEAVTLASSIRPAVEVRELDELAHLIGLIVPEAAQAVPNLDVLSALEFGLRRWPAVLRAPVWARVTHHMQHGPPITDTVRWSAVLKAAHDRGIAPPALVNAYLRAVLSAVVNDSLNLATVWMPGPLTGSHERAALDWAATVLDRSPSLSVAVAVMDTLSQVGVTLPDTSLHHLVGRVIVPHLLDARTADDAAAELARLAERNAALPDHVCAEVESLLAGQLGFTRVVEALPAVSAELLAPHAGPGSRCALALDIVQTRAGTGRRGPVSVLARAIRDGRSSPADVGMVVDLLWPAVPSATEALALCRAVRPELLARTAIPVRLVERLVADAQGPGLSLDDLELAEELSAAPVLASLGAEQSTVQAVRYVGFFGTAQRPPHVDTNADVAVHAIDDTGGVAAPLRKAVLLTLAAWVCAAPDAAVHADVLGRLLSEVRDPAEFLRAYRVELTAVLRDGSSTAIAAVLPALAVLSTQHREIRRLLDKTAVMVLTGRSKRARAGITKAIGSADRRMRPLLKRWRGKAPKSWPVWWDDWQQANLPTSLMRRLVARLRTAKAAD